MTKVTIKCDLIKGMVTIYGNPNNSKLFLAEGNGYIPMELSANTLGEAIDTFMQQLHQLRRTPEAESRNKARGQLIKKRLEERRATESKKHSRLGKTNKTSSDINLSDEQPS